MNLRSAPARTLAAVALLATACAGLLWAGPLDPPSGPVAPTGKTLAEIEPRIAINATNTPGTATALFRITAPGSYYLTGNITGVVGKHGIEIQSSVSNSGITIDLNGFTLQGVTGMGAFDGITMAAVSANSISIRNGTIRRWGRNGINLPSITDGGRIEGIIAQFNVGVGIDCGIGYTLSNCSATMNSGNGIETGFGSTLTNCTGRDNGGNGIDAGPGCTLLNCSGASNTGNGIVTAINNSLTNCSAYTNTGDGISTGNGCTISNCSAQFNNGNGITTLSGNTIIACSAYDNDGIGISLAGNGCTVQQCSARLNGSAGIFAATGSIILNNQCSNNGTLVATGAGITTPGSDNRIEGNNCNGNDLGIDVNAAGNFIIRNTCSGNTTNYSIVADNRYGPIVNITAAGTAAVNGNSAADTSGTTHPWANFAY